MFKKPNREVTEVYVHCSDSDYPHHDDISVIEEWHIARGFLGVGYHYFVTSKGERQLGRDLERPSAAQYGHNSNAIAICTHGKSFKKFTSAQLSEVKKLCYEIDDAYEGKVRFRGHNEVNETKSCPVYDYKKLLNLDEKGYIIRTRVPIMVPVKPTFWQRLLRSLGW